MQLFSSAKSSEVAVFHVNSLALLMTIIAANRNAIAMTQPCWGVIDGTLR